MGSGPALLLEGGVLSFSDKGIALASNLARNALLRQLSFDF